MVELYVLLIIKGKRTLDEVPEKIRDEVRQALIDQGYSDLVDGDD